MGGFGVDSKGGFCAVASTLRHEGLGCSMPAEAAKPVMLVGWPLSYDRPTVASRLAVLQSNATCSRDVRVCLASFRV
jgi:hypothetical protein